VNLKALPQRRRGAEDAQRNAKTLAFPLRCLSLRLCASAVRFFLLAFAASAISSAPTLADEGGRTARPAIDIANPGKCVAPAEEMRRNHMEMLKHQRDRTLRQGVRGEAASLNACIECHASKQTGSVLGSNDNFCQGCHAYAAVKLDCFECHQPKAGFKAAGVKP